MIVSVYKLEKSCFIISRTFTHLKIKILSRGPLFFKKNIEYMIIQIMLQENIYEIVWYTFIVEYSYFKNSLYILLRIYQSFSLILIGYGHIQF